MFRNSLAEDELLFVIETPEVVPAESALRVGSSLVSLVRSSELVAEDAMVVLLELSTGSLRVRLAVAAQLSTILALALMVEDRLRTGGTDFTTQVATICAQNPDTYCSISTAEGSATIRRADIAHVQSAIEESRRAGREVFPADPEGPLLPDLKSLPPQSEFSPAPKPVPLTGKFAIGPSRSVDDLVFQADDGEIYEVRWYHGGVVPRLNVPMRIKASFARGERLGWADRSLLVYDWEQVR